MRLIICYSLSTSIVFIINKVLMCFIIRFFSLISLSLFRFKASNYNIKEARVFNCIGAKIDDYTRDVNIWKKDFKENLKKVKVESSINFYEDVRFSHSLNKL